MKSWESLLSYAEMTGSYRAVPQLADLFFTNTFYKSPRPVYGDTVEMISIAASNTPGPMNTRGGAARMIQPKGGSKRFFSLFHYFTEMTIDPNALMFLRSFDNPTLQKKGQEVVDLQLEESAARHRLAKEVILSHIMTFNRVNIGADGAILLPSVHATTGAITDNSSAQVSADFGVADSHRGNLGGLISAQWSTAGTDIAAQLDAIDRAAQVAGVPKPMHFYVNGLHKSAFANNTQVKAWASYANVNSLGSKVLENFKDDTLVVFNKRFHFISGTYVDSTGTTRDIMPQLLCLMVPDQGPWLRAFTGYTNVPKDVGIASAASPMEDYEEKSGEYAYAFTNHNPVRVSVFAGDTYGLGFADPNCIWVGKVFS